MRSILEKYQKFLPLADTSDFQGLGEGNTPLVAGRAISNDAGAGSLFFKSEHLNPTGSFKDRFAAVEIALMKQHGVRACFGTSSGNTGSALAAYSARNGIKCFLFVNEIAPESKLKQMLVYGAKVFRVKDFGVSNEQSALIFDRLKLLADESGTRLVISAFKYSPEGMEGVKTIAYEIAEQLGGAPDHVFAPVGGGGLLSGIWRGFKDLKERALIDRLPRIHAVQPELNDTVVTPIRTGSDTARQVNTTTGISGLAVQVDIDATLALQSVKMAGGWGFVVSDSEINDAQLQLAVREGIYVEPAGATSVAGYIRATREGHIGKSERSVCILTGHGLKDMASATRMAQDSQICSIELGHINSALIKEV